MQHNETPGGLRGAIEGQGGLCRQCSGVGRYPSWSRDLIEDEPARTRGVTQGQQRLLKALRDRLLIGTGIERRRDAGGRRWGHRARLAAYLPLAVAPTPPQGAGAPMGYSESPVTANVAGVRQ